MAMTVGPKLMAQPTILGFTGACGDFATDALPLGNGYRWYLPSLMRFNALDAASPFGSGGPNAYAYCSNDPLNRHDPSGHFAIGLALGAIGLAISMAPYAIDAVRAGAVAFAEADGAIAGIKAFGRAALSAPVDVFREAPFASKMTGTISLVTGVLSVGLGIAAAETSGSTSEGFEMVSLTAGVMSAGAAGFHTVALLSSWRQALTDTRADLAVAQQDLSTALHEVTALRQDLNRMGHMGEPPPIYMESPPADVTGPSQLPDAQASSSIPRTSRVERLPGRYRRGAQPRAQSPVVYSRLRQQEDEQDMENALRGTAQDID